MASLTSHSSTLHYSQQAATSQSQEGTVAAEIDIIGWHEPDVSHEHDVSYENND